jgi:hypothetical protein
VQACPGEPLVALDVGRKPGVGRHDDDRLERASLAVVAEAEDGHDQERAEDQADQRPGTADDLDHLLADEGQERFIVAGASCCGLTAGVAWRSAASRRPPARGLIAFDER